MNDRSRKIAKVEYGKAYAKNYSYLIKWAIRKNIYSKSKSFRKGAKHYATKRTY